MIDNLEYTPTQRAAAIEAIPNCVSLIYKHRETEEVMWKMIFALAWKLAPQSTASVVNLASGYVSIKHSEHLRTLHSPEKREMLMASIQDSSLFVPCAKVVLIGDPGLAGDGRVHVVTRGGKWHNHQKMSNVVAHLKREGLLF